MKRLIQPTPLGLILLLVMLNRLSPATELTWVGCGITHNAFMADLAAAYQAQTGVAIGIAGGGATKGIHDITGKRADIGGACRYTLNKTPEEAGVLMIPVAWDAQVVVVHKDNPIESITLAQLCDL